MTDRDSAAIHDAAHVQPDAPMTAREWFDAVREDGELDEVGVPRDTVDEAMGSAGWEWRYDAEPGYQCYEQGARIAVAAMVHGPCMVSATGRMWSRIDGVVMVELEG